MTVVLRVGNDSERPRTPTDDLNLVDAFGNRLHCASRPRPGAGRRSRTTSDAGRDVLGRVLELVVDTDSRARLLVTSAAIVVAGAVVRLLAAPVLVEPAPADRPRPAPSSAA